MSDDGEKTCPLCAEEMDLTDQQLKPCKCGYEICVWCWHHIMEMAEKDESEGRCPACRTPYDKEKIVGTASKCERMVAEINMDRKLKSQKAKTKLSDGRKQLSSVRVIQRNLVYIVGLPLNLADEDLLMHKEYFGQYGKVLKVSISRTSAGTIQQFANNSCSVYITYSKEEEAVRCIQSVHGFNLEGRPLRACFGTTKYCHAWLRNALCTNPDCLYLHEVGSTDDSFTKDEIISAYSRVQQITGVSNSAQRRTGSILPPPADDFSPSDSATTVKPVLKSITSSSVDNTRVSPPSNSAGRTGALPPAASWGTRAVTSQSPAGRTVHLNGPTRQKQDVAGETLASSTVSATAAITQSTSTGRKIKLNDDIPPGESRRKLEVLEHAKQGYVNSQNSILENPNTPAGEPVGMVSIGRIPSPSRPFNISKKRDPVNELSNTSAAKERIPSACRPLNASKMKGHFDEQSTVSTAKDRIPSPSRPMNIGKIKDPVEQSDIPAVKDQLSSPSRPSKIFSKIKDPVGELSDVLAAKGRVPCPSKSLNICKVKDPVNEQSDLSAAKGRIHDVALTNGMINKSDSDSISSDKQHNGNDFVPRSPNSSCLDSLLATGKQECQQHCDTEKLQEPSVPCVNSKDSTSLDITDVFSVVSPWRSGFQDSTTQSLSFETGDNTVRQRPSDTMLVTQTNLSLPSNLFDDVQSSSPIHSDDTNLVSHNVNPSNIYKQTAEYASSSLPNSLNVSSDHVSEPSAGTGDSCLLLNGWAGTQLSKSDDFELNPGADVMEKNIISNILSLDLDAWDDSLTSPHDLVKLLGQRERQQGSLNVSNSWKAQNGNQSRFSFARQDCRSQMPGVKPSLNIEPMKAHSFGPTLYESRDLCLDRLPNGFGISHHNGEAYDTSAYNQCVFPANNLNTSRPQISAPPGFSAPSRPPLPGFSSHDISPGNYFHENTSLLRSPYQGSSSMNTSIAADIEFMDPAILAVGKGRPPNGFSNLSSDIRPNIPSPSPGFENDSRLQLLMQTSLLAPQSQRIADNRNNYSPNNGYGFTSRFMEPSQASNVSSLPQFSFQQPKNGVFSNGHYDAWPDVNGRNNIGISELLRNDRVGFNRFYGGYEDPKFQMPSSGNLYNRSFGM